MTVTRPPPRLGQPPLSPGFAKCPLGAQIPPLKPTAIALYFSFSFKLYFGCCEPAFSGCGARGRGALGGGALASKGGGRAADFEEAEPRLESGLVPARLRSSGHPAWGLPLPYTQCCFLFWAKQVCCLKGPGAKKRQTEHEIWCSGSGHLQPLLDWRCSVHSESSFYS